ncbi:MAG: PEP-CTERM sorting domain-containing protein [Akkermansiaceae bacterium]
MKSKLITCAVVAALTAVSQAATTVVFDDSFTGFSNSGLSEQGNWKSQAAFTVASETAIATSGGAFARAQRFGAFRTEVGDQVRITVSGFSITGAVGNNSEDFRLGIAATPEHTGAQTPQVAASLVHDGGSTSLTIGGATDTAYNLGDELTVALTLTRTAADAWSLDSSITNVTDGGPAFTGSATPINLDGAAGASIGLTLGEYLDAAPGNNALFGMRLVGNNTGSTFNIGGVKLETIAVPEPSSSALLGLSGLLVLARRRRS